jgi:hypothetical protein
VSRWSIWAQKFNYYVVVSGRRIKATRNETMPSRDPRFDLDLTIDMDVSVTNAADFVRDYGTDASVIDPFYLTLRGNLREKVRNRVAAEINILNEELQKLSRDICKTGAVHGPVTIHAMDIHAQISQRAMDIFQAMSIHDIAAEHGDAILLALVTQTADEGRRRAYNDFYNARRAKEREDTAAGRDARDDFVGFVERTFGDDPKMRNKLLTDPDFLATMKAAFSERQKMLIANRPVNDSLIPLSPDMKPRSLLARPENSQK